MKKTLLIGILFFSVLYSAYSQSSEYRYFLVRLGVNHNLFNAQPKEATNKYLTTPSGDFLLFPANHELSGGGKYFNYGMSFSGDIQYHYDLKNEHVGFVVGLQYSTNSVGAKYFAKPGTLEEIQNAGSLTLPATYVYNSEYWVVERNKVVSVGIPVFMKFGKEIYINQAYGYIGGQFNYNISLKQSQKVGWSKSKSSVKPSGGLKSMNVLFFAGFNYYIFNFEIDYMPGSFLDVEYKDPDTQIKPFADQPKNVIALKTSITIPLSEWLALKSWQAEKIRRKFKFGE